MTPGAALQAFLNGIMTAYATASVPDDAALPYLTYDMAFGSWESGEVNVTVNMWFRTESEAVPNAKVAELSEAIGLGGKQLRTDSGTIWVKRGSPFAQAVSADEAGVRRRLVNLSLEYISKD